uniref:Ig-like domain-containing protein n=1 Tax=Oryzias latipes TaxID=8090 RepID=A0A3P9JBW9_ORYLA
MASFSPLFPGLTAGDAISPDQDQLTGTEGKSVTMKCNYQTADSYPYLYWYKHDSDLQAPQFILWKGIGMTKIEGLKIQVQNKQIDLQISSAAVSDSAVYYCALQPTVTGNNKTLYKNLQQNTTTSTGGRSNIKKVQQWRLQKLFQGGGRTPKTCCFTSFCFYLTFLVSLRTEIQVCLKLLHQLIISFI